MNKQSGFTLIELMISAVIGIFLLTAIMNLFITTNRTATLSDALSQNQEAGRFAMDYLTRFVRNSGYSANTELSPPELLIPNNNSDFNITCVAAAEEKACAANDLDGILGDRLSFIYVTSPTIERTTCSGRIVGGPDNGGQQRLADVFWVSTDKELRCTTYSLETINWLGSNNPDKDQSIPIINNIETLQFQVGVANKDDDPYVSRYVNVDEVINNSLNKRIRSIRVAVLTTSTDSLDTNKIQTKKESRNYNILDAEQLSFDDGNLRNIFISTIELPASIESAIDN